MQITDHGRLVTLPAPLAAVVRGLEARDRVVAVAALAAAGGDPVTAATRLRVQADAEPCPPAHDDGAWRRAEACFVERRIRVADALEAAPMEFRYCESGPGWSANDCLDAATMAEALADADASQDGRPLTAADGEVEVSVEALDAAGDRIAAWFCRTGIRDGRWQRIGAWVCECRHEHEAGWSSCVTCRREGGAAADAPGALPAPGEQVGTLGELGYGTVLLGRESIGRNER